MSPGISAWRSSWPRSVGQIPVFFGQRPSGRPAKPDDPFTSRYLDLPNEPLYPFGHGLTYGRCRLENLRASPEVASRDDVLLVEVDVVNEGTRAVEETVFLFTRDPLASVTRPLLELRGFARIALQPREARRLSLSLPASELEFPGIDLQPVFEPGEIELLVGPCADRARCLMTAIHLA